MKGACNMTFTIEEITIIKEYGKPNRVQLIDTISSSLPHYTDEEKDMVRLLKSLLEKLNNITDNEYENLDLTDSLQF